MCECCSVPVYLHECNEQEEGVGSPPDLLIQEPGQKGEDSILGGAAERTRARPKSALVNLGNPE